MKLFNLYFFALLLPLFGSCQETKVPKALVIHAMGLDTARTAIFAAGCFWCVEAPFSLLEGVDTVVSGYLGGNVKNPSYGQVTRGNTGHAEAVKVTFNPQKISYDELLEAFFLMHDPTQWNRQGNDVGTQYRSAIFPISTSQLEKATFYIAQLNKQKVYEQAVVTSIETAADFYPAEDYHQNYFNSNPNDRYCTLVIKPKMDKFKKVFAQKLKIAN